VRAECREGICFLLGCGWRGFGGAVLRGMRGAGVGGAMQ